MFDNVQPILHILEFVVLYSVASFQYFLEQDKKMIGPIIEFSIGQNYFL